jgi:hypothetical protein
LFHLRTLRSAKAVPRESVGPRSCDVMGGGCRSFGRGAVPAGGAELARIPCVTLNQALQKLACCWLSLFLKFNQRARVNPEVLKRKDGISKDKATRAAVYFIPPRALDHVAQSTTRLWQPLYTHRRPARIQSDRPVQPPALARSARIDSSQRDSAPKVEESRFRAHPHVELCRYKRGRAECLALAAHARYPIDRGESDGTAAPARSSEVEQKGRAVWDTELAVEFS